MINKGCMFLKSMNDDILKLEDVKEYYTINNNIIVITFNDDTIKYYNNFDIIAFNLNFKK